ncbi:hypothetical protein K469DRAFT_705426 [Zopfia rhizophila CBS 207.26]|uniref:NACHT-NTPase and P-loop NTPases N-terminal domain-containing protein n=1 Tax=Zopfia rhizophila CBS 207.26 TaxID=1314779 RepID=A0A6A6E4R8_9PEZI|nr:hypothetical protein K469DRAFT_705426 [Zopfia rhizophila CBS 207.26]
MSGLEGLAAVAAAAQLVEYSIKIALSLSHVRDRIREAPERFKQYASQVNQLVIIARRVEQNPTLQTPEVHFYLSAILTETQAAQRILDGFSKDSHKHRYWRVISGSSQRKIIERLDSVHRTVADLSLYIGSMSTTQLEKVQGSVDRLTGIATELVHVPRAAIPHSSPSAGPRRRATKQVLRRQLSVKKAIMPDIGFNRAKGSHVFEGVRIEDNSMCTIGNVTTSDVLTMAPGHSYLNVQVLGNLGLQMGNVGPSQGHIYKEVDFKKNEASTLGDYSNLDAREEDFRKKREAQKSIPH